jgi:site-specific DNA-cytosine methylase
MTNNLKIILDLCGGTGSWSKPYKEVGYDVRLITLPANDVRTYEPPEGVYGILAAPPCTLFSLAKNKKSKEAILEAWEIVKACLRIIEKCKPSWYCIENPRGLLKDFLGPPDMRFYQWQYGTKTKKPTFLWGHFNRPIPTVSEMPEIKTIHRNSADYSNPKCPSEYKHLKLKRSDIRAITPSGFARAFFEANP